MALSYKCDWCHRGFATSPVIFGHAGIEHHYCSELCLVMFHVRVEQLPALMQRFDPESVDAVLAQYARTRGIVAK